MKKIYRVLIIENDKEFLDKLADELCSEYEVVKCSKEKDIVKKLNDDFALILVNENINHDVLDLSLASNSSSVLVKISEEKVSSERETLDYDIKSGGTYVIYKYDSLVNIRKILSSILKKKKMNIPKVISCISLKNSSSRNISEIVRLCAVRNKVLYVNLKILNDIENHFNILDDSYSLINVFYGTDIVECIYKVNRNLSIVYPSKNPVEFLEISNSKITSFIKELKTLDYDYIFIEQNEERLDLCLRIFELSSEIMFLVNDDSRCMEKILAKYLTSVKKQNLISKFKEVCVDDLGNIKRKDVLSFLVGNIKNEG